MDSYDVVIVGGGNAGLCAAHAALEHTSRVLLVEKAPEDWAGGNSSFTQGSFRTVIPSLEEVRDVLANPEDPRLDDTIYPAYTDDDFMADMLKATAGRCDRELATTIVENSTDTLRWLASKGLKWELAYDRRAFQVDGKWKFWGGGSLRTSDHGRGLIAQHREALAAAGLEIRFDTALRDLVADDDGRVVGVRCQTPEGIVWIGAGAVVLACGGFGANPAMRAAYLGPGWDWAAVRGTPFNTGDGFAAALLVGAQTYGNWSGCHSVAWDASADPAHGHQELGNKLTRSSYQLGIVVNERSERFLDEGADLRTLTYAKYGAEVLKQPNHRAFQIFDAKARAMLNVEYDFGVSDPFVAESIHELGVTAGIDPQALTRTVDAFNTSIMEDQAFDPTIRDGRGTHDLTPPKSNWAMALTEAPFYAFPVMCGITFTYGGIRVTPDAVVVNGQNWPIEGLFACGEMVGGVFYGNYPGGSGLMSGAVFGRRAGANAAQAAGRSIYAAPAAVGTHA